MKVDLKPYCFSVGNNLGDITGLYILKKYFPDIEFNSLSKNYVFFGGSTFHHHETFLPGKPNYILYFGNGLSSFNELRMPSCDYKIYPRGFYTQAMFRHAGIKTEIPIGDITQFLALEEKLTFNPRGKNVYVKDAFVDIKYIPAGEDAIAVCSDNLTQGYRLVNSLKEFKSVLSGYKKIVSSQIHPFLMALMMRFPAKLIPKDIRSLDICGFYNIDFDCNENAADHVRIQSLGNLNRIKETFYQEMKQFEI